MNFRLKIGPAIYECKTVARLEGADGSKLDGQIMHGSEKLWIEEELPSRSQQVTVVHEVLHAILQQAGQHKLYKDEGLLDALAYGLIGAQLNPGEVTELGTPVLEPLLDAIDGRGE